MNQELLSDGGLPTPGGLWLHAGTLHYAILWYDENSRRMRFSNGEKGVFKNSPPLGKDAKPVGTIIGDFAQSHTEF